MIIRMDTDQIKKIRDDAFECAAKLLEEAQAEVKDVSLNGIIAAIRSMKDSPVNVLVKGKD